MGKIIIYSVTFLLIALSCNLSKNNYYSQAQELREEGKLEEALNLFDKAVADSPNNLTILHERGLLKSDVKKYEEAISDLNKSIEDEVDSKKIKLRLWNRALVFFEMGDTISACEDWTLLDESDYIKKYCN